MKPQSLITELQETLPEIRLGILGILFQLPPQPGKFYHKCTQCEFHIMLLIPQTTHQISSTGWPLYEEKPTKSFVTQTCPSCQSQQEVFSGISHTEFSIKLGKQMITPYESLCVACFCGTISESFPCGECECLECGIPHCGKPTPTGICVKHSICPECSHQKYTLKTSACHPHCQQSHYCSQFTHLKLTCSKCSVKRRHYFR
jgi:hypothetical protein